MCVCVFTFLGSWIFLVVKISQIYLAFHNLESTEDYRACVLRNVTQLNAVFLVVTTRKQYVERVVEVKEHSQHISKELITIMAYVW